MEQTFEERIKSLYKEGTKGIRKELEKAFPELIQEDPYIKACKILGITPVAELSADADPDQLWADACYRLAICIRAKNLLPNGSQWKQVYDGNERHYWPIFSIVEDTARPSGLGLAFYFTDYWCTSTLVGARLEYRTYDLACEGAKEFIKYYTIIHLYEQK